MYNLCIGSCESSGLNYEASFAQAALTDADPSKKIPRSTL